MSRQNREQEILNAAIQVFASKGFGSATTAEIAAIAGVAEGTVFRYFKTKKDILLSVFGTFIEKFSENIVVKPVEEILERGDSLPVDEVLKMLIKDRMPLFETHYEMLLVVLGEIRFHPELQELIQEKVASRAMAVITGYVTRAMDRGQIKKLPPETVARVIIGNLLSFIVQRATSMFGDHAELEQELDLVVGIILNGILEEGA